MALRTSETMKEKKETVQTSAYDTASGGGKNQEQDDPPHERILLAAAKEKSPSREGKDLARERSNRVLTRLRSNSSLFGDQVKQGRKSSMSTVVSGEGER